MQQKVRKLWLARYMVMVGDTNMFMGIYMHMGKQEFPEISVWSGPYAYEPTCMSTDTPYGYG